MVILSTRDPIFAQQQENGGKRMSTNEIFEIFELFKVGVQFVDVGIFCICICIICKYFLAF